AVPPQYPCVELAVPGKTRKTRPNRLGRHVVQNRCGSQNVRISCSSLAVCLLVSHQCQFILTHACNEYRNGDKQPIVEERLYIAEKEEANPEQYGDHETE